VNNDVKTKLTQAATRVSLYKYNLSLDCYVIQEIVNFLPNKHITRARRSVLYIIQKYFTQSTVL